MDRNFQRASSLALSQSPHTIDVAAALPGRSLSVPGHLWRDDYGALRKGRTGDLIQMLTDLGIRDRAF